MGFPIIPNITPVISLTREDAISLVVASIAMEELSLSHIMNAEGEKIQALLASTPTASLSDMLAINSSVQAMLEVIAGEEAILGTKLSNALGAGTAVGPTGPIGPTGPTASAGLTDFAQISTASGPWPAGSPLTSVPVVFAHNDLLLGTAITHTPGTSQIQLAAGTYQISWELFCLVQLPQQASPLPVNTLFSYEFAAQLSFNGSNYSPSLVSNSAVSVPGILGTSQPIGDAPAPTSLTIELSSTDLFVAPASGLLEVTLRAVPAILPFDPTIQSLVNAKITLLKTA